MNNQLVSEENISKIPPEWPRVNIPGNAIQGSILLTVNQFVEPPQDASNLKWLPMEDIIGTANVKMEYNEELNLFNFYKAKGHLNNDKTWVYEWELFASVAGISEETQEELKNLKYVSYRYDTSIPNSLVVYGIKKDGVQELLCNINFVSSQQFAIAVNNLTNQIVSEIQRATNRENQIESNLNDETERATTQENSIRQQLNNEITRATNSEQALQNSIDDVRENLAEYIGNFENKAALDAYSGTVNNNDYAVVLDDETHDHECWRYIYKASTNSWLAQYMINEEPMTAAQLAALNSGINTTKVAQIETNRQNILTKQNQLTSSNGITLANDIISAKVNTTQGVSVDNNGIAVKLSNRFIFDSKGKIDYKLQKLKSQRLANKQITVDTIPLTENNDSISYTITDNDINDYRMVVYAVNCRFIEEEGEPLPEMEKIEVRLRINNYICVEDVINLKISSTDNNYLIQRLFTNFIPMNNLKSGDEINLSISFRNKITSKILYSLQIIGR